MHKKPSNYEELKQHIQVRKFAQDKQIDGARSYYCGRGSKPGFIDGHIGNPFLMGRHGDRITVCLNFMNLLKGNFKAIPIFEIWHLEYLRSKALTAMRIIKMDAIAHPTEPIHLYCHCKPLKCHCDFIKDEIIRKLAGVWKIDTLTPKP